MWHIRNWMALTIIGGLFLLVGIQGMAYAQMSNDTSMMKGNETSMMGNDTSMMKGNETSMMGNETGNVSGLGGQGP